SCRVWLGWAAFCSCSSRSPSAATDAPFTMRRKLVTDYEVYEDTRCRRMHVSSSARLSATRIGRAVLLRGRDVILRPLRAEVGERVVEIQAEAGVSRWWGAPDEADLNRLAEGRGKETALVIEREDELVGFIQFAEESDPDFRHAGIDLFLSEHHQGQGL